MIRINTFLLAILLMGLTLLQSHAQRQMESLDRGLVAVPREDGSVLLSWRILGTEAHELGFNVFHIKGDNSPKKINLHPITASTNFVVENPVPDAKYLVKPISDKPKEVKGQEVKAWSKKYLSIPLKTPDGYTPNDASVGDLNGDGQYEIVIHQRGRAHDNSHRGYTDEPILQAYTLEGEFLWEINLGKNIREGAHYTQFMVYDLDGDGRAELACKTADGTTDALGNVIGDADADYRNDDGYILSGPEFLTIFDGETGEALATADYIPPRHPEKLNPTSEELDAIWGDGYGNRMDRFLAGIAYLDGEQPSLIMTRGYYTRTVIAAWNWRDGNLSEVWTFDSHDGNPEHRKFAGQGYHSLHVADVDKDHKDEVVFGAMVIDDDGTGVYSTGLGHGDALHLTDLDPERPGMEIFGIHEHVRHEHGANLRDAETGEVIWSHPSPDVGRGVALDIDPRHPGHEAWASGKGLHGLWNIKGEVISEKKPSSCNMGIWWDGDLLREILNGVDIDKWDYENEKSVRIFTGDKYNVAKNNGTKSNPALCADIFGDWREELIGRTEDGKELRIFTTPIPSEHRFYTLMHDPVYRLSVAWQNVAYNQPPHTGFFLGHGMEKPPRPHITLIKSTK
ncbi:rhamnogalacturonan lyase [Echinicola jeungdonensis]|uniref:Rhamnogalacturonan lyase n=1 Tax=Echinicola jeungdonensis TaxID=709343 RepID=A0ABV5J6N7_9BACT|nr:rhamnogalacturonan lyase [Echinicola jeungdonensis]MDN3669525.1 rhamnogalacturonan lyase [Echinicola jeungdonensis]